MQVQIDGNEPRPVDQSIVKQAWRNTGLEYPEGLSEMSYVLHPEENLIPYKDEAAFVTAVLMRRAANCESQAKLMSLSDPELNIATGWLNNATNEKQPNQETSYLSSHEQHAWAVDEQGVIRDRTPYRMAAEMRRATEKYFAENNLTPTFVYDEDKNFLKRWWNDYKLPGTGLLVGAVLIARRRGRKFGEKVAARIGKERTSYYQKQATGLPPELAGQAYGAIQQFFFDPSKKGFLAVSEATPPKGGREVIDILKAQIDPQNDYEALTNAIERRIRRSGSRDVRKAVTSLLRVVALEQKAGN